jgi:hypothetical protein
LNDIDTMKRSQLQAETVTRFGKSAAQWTGRATNEELREALRSGEPPAGVATANGNGGVLAALIAASVAPLLADQLNEERVSEIIEERLSSYRGTALQQEAAREMDAVLTSRALRL